MYETLIIDSWFCWNVWKQYRNVSFLSLHIILTISLNYTSIRLLRLLSPQRVSRSAISVNMWWYMTLCNATHDLIEQMNDAGHLQCKASPPKQCVRDTKGLVSHLPYPSQHLVYLANEADRSQWEILKFCVVYSAVTTSVCSRTTTCDHGMHGILKHTATIGK